MRVRNVLVGDLSLAGGGLSLAGVGDLDLRSFSISRRILSDSRAISIWVSSILFPPRFSCRFGSV